MGALKKEASRNLEEVKRKLLNRKRELEQNLAQNYKEKAPADVQDIGDQALSAVMETLRSSLQDRELEEYNMIVKVLQKIEAGQYGLCSECSKPISEKRLNVYPNATRCLACQEALEG